MKKCIICGNSGDEIFSSTILRKYKIKYYRCPTCEAIYTEDVYWSEEAYKDALTRLDTGVLKRNICYAEQTEIVIRKLFCLKEFYALDFAGGYGIFVRLMRDKGYRFLWSDKYAENLMARGYEYHDEKVDLVTAFEVFEHLDKPIDDIERIMSYGSSILFSAELYDGNKIPSLEWWYWCFETGQHVCFYSEKTLDFIAQKYGWYYYSLNRNLHLFKKEKISKIQRDIMILSVKIIAKRKVITERKRKSLTENDFAEQRKILKEENGNN